MALGEGLASGLGEIHPGSFRSTREKVERHIPERHSGTCGLSSSPVGMSMGTKAFTTTTWEQGNFQELGLGAGLE